MAAYSSRCARCGEHYRDCPHIGTITTDMDSEEADRVRARYAIGKLHNPDHDTTSYRDAPTRQNHPQPQENQSV